MDLSIWQTIILSFIEGFAWIVPLSDVGVVGLARKLVGLPMDGSGDGLLTAVCQAVSVLVTLLFFRKDWTAAFRTVSGRASRNTAILTKISLAKRLTVLMSLGILPAAGYLIFQNFFLNFGMKVLFVVAMMVLGGFLIFSCDRVGHGKRSIEEAFFGDGMLVAVMQLVGCVPGLTPSGLGVAAGIWRGLTPAFSVKLSCLLLVPRLLISSAYGIVVHWGQGISWWLALGVLFGGIGTYFALRLIRFAAMRRNLGEFAYFVWGASLFLFVLYLFG